MHHIFNVQRKEETKKSGFGAGCSAKGLWNILQASPTVLVKSRSNVFFLLKNLIPNLSPSRMSLFRLWDLKFSVIWRQYSSQSLNGQLPTTDSKRTKEGVPALTSFPGCFPEKMGGAGKALLQYLYLTFYIGSHFSITGYTELTVVLQSNPQGIFRFDTFPPVSYTHLTLPTKRIV